MIALRGSAETSRNETVRHCVQFLVPDQSVTSSSVCTCGPRTAVQYAHVVREQQFSMHMRSADNSSVFTCGPRTTVQYAHAVRGQQFSMHMRSAAMLLDVWSRDLAHKIVIICKICISQNAAIFRKQLLWL